MKGPFPFRLHKERELYDFQHQWSAAAAAAEVTIRLFPIFYDRRRGDVAATAFVVVEQYSNTQTYCVLLLLLHTQAALLWWLMLPFTMGRVIKSKDVLVAQKSLFVIENTHTYQKKCSPQNIWALFH